MKTRTLLVWACLAFSAAFIPQNLAAQETETKKEKRKEKKEITIITTEDDSVRRASRDSLESAIRDLHDDLRKMQIQLEKKIEKDITDEKILEELEAELDELEDKLDEMDEALEELEDNDIDIDFGAADTGKSKNKKIIITDDGIEINIDGKEGKKKKWGDMKHGNKKSLRNSKIQLLGLDLGVNAFTNSGNFSLQPEAAPLDLNLPKSINVSLHLIRQGVNIYRHNVYATYGLTLDMHDYRLANKNISIIPSTDRFDTINEPITFEKSKLTAHYLTVPVMFHFETNPRKPSNSFKLGVGGYGGMLINSYTKQVSKERGKQHFYDDFNLNKMNYGVRAQIGYGIITLYSHYALSPLFQENKGPNLNPVTFGLVLNGFKWN